VHPGEAIAGGPLPLGPRGSDGANPATYYMFVSGSESHAVSTSMLCRQLANVADELLNLFLRQFAAIGRHLVISLRDDLIEISIALFLDILGSEIANLEYFADRGLSSAIRTVAGGTIRFEDVFTGACSGNRPERDETGCQQQHR